MRNSYSSCSTDNPEDLFFCQELCCDYIYIDTGQELEKYKEKLLSAKVLFLDTETTGLDFLQDNIRLLQVGLETGENLILDFYKIRNIRQFCKQLLENSNSIKVFHNAKFDINMLKRENIFVDGQLFDTEIAARLIEAGLRLKGFSLQDIVKRYLNKNMDKTEQKSNWNISPLSDRQLYYAAKDVDILRELYHILREQLIKEKLVKIAKLEFDTIYATAEMECSGVKLDLQKWNSLKRDYKQEMLEMRYIIHEFLGKQINIESSLQLRNAINVVYGLNLTSTADEILASLKGYPIATAIRRYRKAFKKVKSFLNTIPQYIHNKTKRIHPTYWQLGSCAGRYSCSKPNIQQIPREQEFRQCFIAEAGNKIVNADFGQLELRIAAQISKDETMIEAYKKGIDLHRQTASLFTGKPIEEITKTERQTAKACNFGLIYGIQPKTLKVYSETKYGVPITIQEAQKYYNKFFEKYRGIKRWHNFQKKTAITRRQTRTLGGRRRLWRTRPPFTEVVNTPVQGTGIDMTKRALVLVYQYFKKDPDVKIISMVHDEISLECPEEKSKEVAEVLSDLMVKAGEEFLTEVPIEAEAKIGDSWGDCK